MSSNTPGLIYQWIEEVQPFIPCFIRSRESDLKLLKLALRNHDFKLIFVIAIRFKGSGASYGFFFYSELGQKMLLALEEQNVSMLHHQIKQAENYLTFLKKRLHCA